MITVNPSKSILCSVAYLGPVHYFAAMVKAERVFIEREENYPKQTYRNRSVILTANGPFSLTIPVIKVDGNHTKIQDILISYREKWQLIHWRAIASAYRKSPFFLYYADELETIIFSNEEKLFDFNLHLTEVLLKMLKVEVEISLTEKYEAKPAGDILDVRNHFSPMKRLTSGFPPYMQVFSDRIGFVPGMSIIDLLFNVGPDAVDYLNRMKVL